MAIPVFNADSADLDQTPLSVASDLGLHCLSVSLLWEARHKYLLKILPSIQSDKILGQTTF